MKMLKYLKPSINVLMILLLSSSCHAGNTTPKLTFDNALEMLYLALGGLEYPSNETHLKDCQEKKLDSCISTYDAVQQAKQYLQTEMKNNKDAVFTHITDTITQQCPKKQSSDTNSDSLCNGAIMALYFYNDVEYDKKIQHFITNSNKSVVNSILFTRYEWQYNRPDANQWISLINNLPATVISDDDKKPSLINLKKSFQPFEKFGLML